MDGGEVLGRQAKRIRRVARWSVRLSLAEARLRRDHAWLHGC